MSDKSTMVELIPELEKLHGCEEREQLILEAKIGEFHDFKNNKYVYGKMQLVRIMDYWIKKYPQDKIIAEKIRSDVASGVYDEKADESDKEMMRRNIIEDCGNNEQAEKLIKALGL